MTQERFDMVLFGEDGRSGFLRWCWIPRNLAAAWFDSKNLRRPGHLFPVAQTSEHRGPPAAEMPAIPNGQATAEPGGKIATQASFRRKPAGLNFQEADAPLVAEMKRLIDAHQAHHRWDAALAVVGRAKGHGNAQSKAKRLLGRYSDTFGAERDGEDWIE
jgi:hypothetical protein